MNKQITTKGSNIKDPIIEIKNRFQLILKKLLSKYELKFNTIETGESIYNDLVKELEILKKEYKQIDWIC